MFHALTGCALADARGKDWMSTFLPERGRDHVRPLFARAAGGASTVASIKAILIRSVEERVIEWHDTVIRGTDVRAGDGGHCPADVSQEHQGRDPSADGGTLTLETSATDVDAAFVTATHDPTSTSGRYVAFRGSETGTGIPPEIADRMFDRFFTTKDPEHGADSASPP